MNIEALPEKTQQQLRDLMEWTETTSPDKVVIDAIEKAWQAVKLETFGDPEMVVIIKASGPGGTSASMRRDGVTRGNWKNAYITSDYSNANEVQRLACEHAAEFLKHGLIAPAQIALGAVFDHVIIEGPGY
ncbi:MAG TPA: hypothetical protein VHV10_20330 [Ktedonobacteraceae bacterium]|jgi:hypothetical protein|nr:hypothetical protein [Ktedonobacteraceae bacterium]